MRQEPNKEMDLLLRQLSRRNGVPVSETDEQHLDADELNSYVANALPAAARARYTEHLADCSSCRKLVAQLSAAQGPVVVPASVSVVAPSGVRSFLASLFSPMVLRYALPAVGLMVIVAAGIVMLRQEQPGASVARLADTEQNKSALPSPPPAEKTSAATQAEAPATKKEAPQERPEARTAKAAPVAAAPPVSEPVATAEAPPPAPKAAATAEFTDQRAEESKRAEELKKQKQATADTTAAASVTGAAPASSERAANQPAKNDYRRTDEITTTPGAITSTASPMRRERQGAVAGAGRSISRSEDSAKDGETASGETRSVAGRRFRKNGGVWIDTAYDSSKGVTNVARGSEQYRALVADEPSIRAIAEQLDGEIIVVWKGRTYRIR